MQRKIDSQLLVVLSGVWPVLELNCEQPNSQQRLQPHVSKAIRPSQTSTSMSMMSNLDESSGAPKKDSNPDFSGLLSGFRQVISDCWEICPKLHPQALSRILRQVLHPFEQKYSIEYRDQCSLKGTSRNRRTAMPGIHRCGYLKLPYSDGRQHLVAKPHCDC